MVGSPNLSSIWPVNHVANYRPFHFKRLRKREGAPQKRLGREQSKPVFETD